jgi:hypothetical protein
MKAVCSSKILVPTYPVTHHNIFVWNFVGMQLSALGLGGEHFEFYSVKKKTIFLQNIYNYLSGWKVL